MGILRLILAFSVVAGHGSFYRPFFLINAGAAVVCFFIVSGFYMALVIDEKYAKLDRWRIEFMANRALRLYPVYFAALALFVGFDAGAGLTNFFVRSADIGTLWHWLIAALNFTIVGQDLFVVAFESGNIAFPTVSDGLDLLVVGQAWSVGVEIVLYLLAALTFHRRGGIIAVLVAAVVVRGTLEILGFSGPPWGNKFVLDVAVFFAMGGATYLVYKRVRHWPTVTRGAGAAALITALGLLAWWANGFWNSDSASIDAPLAALYLGLAALVPVLFSLSRASPVDYFLGSLSYPIYLTHILLFRVAAFSELTTEQTKPFILVSSLALGLVLVLLIDRPLERLRHRRGLVSQPVTNATLPPTSVPSQAV